MSYEVLFNKFQKDYETTNDWNSSSSLWVLNGNNWESIEESEDAYELMISFAAYGYLKRAILVTHGWASPIDDSHTPSKHPEKKRVRVCIHLEGENFVTCMQVKDETELFIQDDPSGNLIDTALKYVNRARDFVNQQNTFDNKAL
jgi:hypothetical protein